jgi:predicted RNA-binding Zn-ribbon protein involved in translation (DUF1610 family)
MRNGTAIGLFNAPSAPPGKQDQTTMDTVVTAPFSPEQVQALNEVQCGITHPMAMGHPFTCPNRGDGVVYRSGRADYSRAVHGQEVGDLGVLIATESGWVCPYCGYAQDWAWAAMAQPLPPTMVGEGFGSISAKEIRARTLRTIETRKYGYTNMELRLAERQMAEMGPRGDAASPESMARWRQTSRALRIMVACISRRELALYGAYPKPNGTLEVDTSWTAWRMNGYVPKVGDKVLVVRDYGGLGGCGAGANIDPWYERFAIEATEICTMGNGGAPMFLWDAVTTGHVAYWKPRERA